jgi:sporulation protein YunB
MQARRRPRRLPRGSVVSFVLLVFFFFLLIEGFIMVERKLRPAILAIAAIKAHGLAIEAINEAILENVARGILYQDLINVEQNNEGRIVMAQINSMEVNRVVAEATIATRKALSDLEKRQVSIPLGEAMDNYLLATYGPDIPVRLVPFGRVNTEIIDSFEEAGINQTRHKIYLHINTEVQIVIPFIAESVQVETTVPVADAVYMGEVPDTVINLFRNPP